MSMVVDNTSDVARQQLVLQTQMLGINTDALSPDLREQYKDLLDEYLSADRETRIELVQTLKELLDPDNYVEVDTIDVDDWGAGTPESEKLKKRKRDFGRRLDLMMKKCGIKAKELAAALGVTPSCISQFTSGKHKPQSSTIRRLAAALGCKETDLWPD